MHMSYEYLGDAAQSQAGVSRPRGLGDELTDSALCTVNHCCKSRYLLTSCSVVAETQITMAKESDGLDTHSRGGHCRADRGQDWSSFVSRSVLRRWLYPGKSLRCHATWYSSAYQTDKPRAGRDEPESLL